jgi:hypothetical protein
MHVNVAKELAALEAMTVAELRARYAQVLNEETRIGCRALLVKHIVWGMQALAEGNLSERARQRAAELVQNADLRLLPPRQKQLAPSSPKKRGKANGVSSIPLPLPGTILTRWYKGKTLSIQVLRHGFEYDGQIYKSLSAVAKVITGSHTSGLLFFRRSLNGKGDRA